MIVRLLRVVWASLPFTAGPAAGHALERWSSAPRVLAEVLLWAAWALVLVSVLAPRPLGLTVLRVVASVFLALAFVVAFDTDIPVATRATALAAMLVTFALAVSPPVSVASANGAAYGDEKRFPLRIPPSLLIGPVPVAALLTGAGFATGPLLLADGRTAWGVVAVVAGAPAVAFLGRALHGLSRRWAVLVPAGLVLADPLTLADPVLFLRERVVALRAGASSVAPSHRALDLRLGAQSGTTTLVLDRPTDLLETRRGRRGAVGARVTEVLFAVVRRDDLLRTAAGRRLPVG
jgi:hypothetical protein